MDARRSHRAGVAYGSDTDRVRELLLGCAIDHEDVLSTPEPYALFVDFGDSALLFELREFVRDADGEAADGAD